ncbi:hypothetical protein CHISP_3180 [Chitinispirillum alkaliphilum]|nr:hypothetical protein CHISP_3180 [Chitinispirillum alkaliphilum]
MNKWNIDSLAPRVERFGLLDEKQRNQLVEQMNRHFPPPVFNWQLERRRKALENSEKGKKLLSDAAQEFPPFMPWQNVSFSPESLNGYGVVFTAGGEGERLRTSLLARGADPHSLKDFTKATYPLENFFQDFGALHINLALIASFCKKNNLDIPVIITTGPKGSITERVIPRILEEKEYFGLKNVRIVAQEQRLHFTKDEKIAYTVENNTPNPVTQPDETGGPLMILKQKPDTKNLSCLEWLETLGCSKIILAQATAIYDQTMLPLMAQAAKQHDCIGVGVLRDQFPPDDPFGTFIAVKKNSDKKTCIIEQAIRNEITRNIKDPKNKFFLPFNTGFYALDCNLLKESDLPDYATPPKEITPELPRSPKVGYAATDILPMANNPLILTIDPKMYAVIKTAEDLTRLSQAARDFGLLDICKKSI